MTYWVVPQLIPPGGELVKTSLRAAWGPGCWLRVVELLRRQVGRQAGELQVSLLLSCYSDKVGYVSPSLLDVLFSNKYPGYLYPNLAPNSGKILNKLTILK